MTLQSLGTLRIDSVNQGSGYQFGVECFYDDAQDIANNKTSGVIKVAASTSGGGLFDLTSTAWGASLFKVASPDAVVVSESGSAAPNFSGGTFWLKETTAWEVTHNDDGTASLYMQDEWLGTGGGGNFAGGFPFAQSSTFALPTIPRGGKRWNGSAWAPFVVKRWSGSAWVTTVPKRWSGSAWVPLF